MRRSWKLLLALALTLTLVAALAVVPGCRKQMVNVHSGEIVICTQGEIVSDTTEEIEVPADEVAGHGVTTEVITCDLHTKLAALHAEALQAIADGDLETAERVLAEIASSDSAYRNTSSMLADVRAKTGGSVATTGGAIGSSGGETPGSGTATPPPGGGTTDPGGDTPVGPIANLTDYIPDRLPGFIGQRIYSDPFNLFRDYLPEKSGTIIQLSVEVEQMQDAAMVTRRIDERIKANYPNDAQSIKVGSLDSYFGTRPRYAILAMSDGAILVVMEFATSSDKPAQHKDALVSVAKIATGQ